MSIDDSTCYQTSIAIKIRFPNSRTDWQWAIEEQTQKTTYAVPRAAVIMAIGCAKPITKHDLYLFLTSKLEIKNEIFENTLASLVEKKIIFFSHQLKKDKHLKNIKMWKRSDWNDAADYHFYTWDAPFLDYTKKGKGHEIDRKKMLKYQDVEPDTFRCKKYADVKQRHFLPFPAAIEGKELSTEESVKYLLASVFGKTGEKPCHWTNTPLMRRTSPSGGSRHPSEGYFVPSDLLDMENGFYHIQSDPTALCLLCSQFDEIFYDHPPASHLGTIIITSVFERNMYRYREPRTFRTVHMDVGHVIASIELISNELGLESHVSLRFNKNSILKAIGSSNLEEGVMAVVSIRKKD